MWFQTQDSVSIPVLHQVFELCVSPTEAMFAQNTLLPQFMVIGPEDNAPDDNVVDSTLQPWQDWWVYMCQLFALLRRDWKILPATQLDELILIAICL